MPIAFTPVDALTKLYKIDPNSAKYLLAGIAVFGAASIVSAAHVDVPTMGLVGLYVLALGLLLIVVANLPVILRVILGTFIVLLIIAVLSTIFISCVTVPAWPKPSYCLVKFWMPCSKAEEAYAERNAPSLNADVNIAKVISAPASLPKPMDASAPKDQVKPVPVIPPRRVFIQFAGMITRDSVRNLNASLARGGWLMQSTSGERTEVAAGMNELRYGQETDAAAAGKLADAVTATGITSSPVVPRYYPQVGKENFELWISK